MCIENISTYLLTYAYYICCYRVVYRCTVVNVIVLVMFVTVVGLDVVWVIVFVLCHLDRVLPFGRVVQIATLSSNCV